MDRILSSSNKFCRLCLTESVVYYSLLEEDRAFFLETLTSIKIEDEQSLPTSACIKCCLSLKYAFQIQQNILEADRKIRSIDFNLDNEETSELLQKPMNINLGQESDVEEQVENDINNFFIGDSQNYTSVEEMDQTEFKYIKLETEPNIETEIKPQVVAIKSEVNFFKKSSNESVEVTKNIQILENSQVPCKICGLEFPEKELMEHTQIHYFSSVKCDECNMPCENIHAYRQHLLEEHKDIPTNKSWVCKTCKVSFLYKPLYIIHFKSAHLAKAKLPETQAPGTYPCSYCKKQFYNEKRCDAHMAVHKKKQCDICGVYITPSNFPAHRRSHLEDEVECPICRRKYKNTVSLKGHIHYTHSQRTYMCEFCDKTFKKSYSLLLHIKREHTGEKSHVCDLCGKSFLTFYNLSKHKKMTHLKLRPFQCEYCQKNFSSKFALRTHERQHTLDAPFECDLCGQSYRQKVSLKSHKKSVHKVEEPLTCACEVCGKRFSNKFAVMSHMRLH